MLCGIKYAVVRDNPLEDSYLKRILDYVNRGLVISGIGERPAIDHFRDFALAGFTSGSVCIAPRLSTLLHAALKTKDYGKAAEIRALFLSFEDLRDNISPLRVLHEAVTLVGIANMGPMLPMLSNIDDQAMLNNIKATADILRRRDEAAGAVKAA